MHGMHSSHACPESGASAITASPSPAAKIEGREVEPVSGAPITMLCPCLFPRSSHPQRSVAAGLLPPQQFFFMSPLIQQLMLNGACQVVIYTEGVLGHAAGISAYRRAGAKRGLLCQKS